VKTLRGFLAAWLDLRSITFIVGMALVAGGLVMVYTPAALIVPGASLSAIAVFLKPPGGT